MCVSKFYLRDFLATYSTLLLNILCCAASQCRAGAKEGEEVGKEGAGLMSSEAADMERFRLGDEGVAVMDEARPRRGDRGAADGGSCVSRLGVIAAHCA